MHSELCRFNVYIMIDISTNNWKIQYTVIIGLGVQATPKSKPSKLKNLEIDKVVVTAVPEIWDLLYSDIQLPFRHFLPLNRNHQSVKMNQDFREFENIAVKKWKAEYKNQDIWTHRKYIFKLLIHKGGVNDIL